MKYPFLEANGQRSADFLGLTIAGAIRIACYDEQTHVHAFDSIAHNMRMKRGEITDTIRYYSYICNDYCRAHFLDPDYSVINKLAMQFKISPEDELYLPKEQRVKVDIPVEEVGYKKCNAKQESNPGPRKPLPSTLHMSKHLFPFSPKDRSKMDDIAEVIKLVGYIAAGIHGPVFSSQDALQSFMAKAQLKINEMIERREKYILDLVSMIAVVDDFIEWTITKHNALPHIKKISSVEDAKLKAHTAIAEFAPKLLKPFREKGIV